jgi:hypothetical protein
MHNLGEFGVGGVEHLRGSWPYVGKKAQRCWRLAIERRERAETSHDSRH